MGSQKEAQLRYSQSPVSSTGDDRSYFIVSRVPGETLAAVWRDMDEDENCCFC